MSLRSSQLSSRTSLPEENSAFCSAEYEDCVIAGQSDARDLLSERNGRLLVSFLSVVDVDYGLVELCREDVVVAEGQAIGCGGALLEESSLLTYGL